MSDMELIQRPTQEVAREEDFMPLLSVAKAVERKQMMNDFISKVLKEGDDYGKMPGDHREDAKKVLKKPGAEKLCSIFGMAPQYLEDKIVEDWTGEQHGGELLFYYSYRCQLSRAGRFMGESIGSANSWETKYRYRWVSEDVAESLGFNAYEDLPQRGGRQRKFEPDFAISNRESSGQYGHPGEYWDQFTAQAGAVRVTGKKLGKGDRTYNGWEISFDATLYRIPNPDVADVINTLQKMAQKRALVAAVLIVTNCSDAFTQDVEDMEAVDLGGDHPEGTNTRPHPAQEHAEKLAEGLHLPEELAGLFGPDAPAKGSTTAFEIVRRELQEALGDKGADEYRRILALNHIKDKGNKLADVKVAVIQCWTLAKQVKLKTGYKDPAEDHRQGDGSASSEDWGQGRE